MPRVRLSEKAVTKLLKRRPRKREDHWDKAHTGFCLRLTPAGAATYAVGAQFGGPNLSRREIGNARVMEYGTALAKAKEWLELDQQGKDPRVVEAERLAAEAAAKLERERLNGHIFNNVADDYVNDAVRGKMRNPREIERRISVLRSWWGSRSVHSIRRAEIATLIKTRKSTPAEARNLCTTVKMFFRWAADQATYGLDESPATDIRPASLVGERNSRERTLSIDEVRKVWAATYALGQPFQAAYQILVLSGLRLNEVAGARWGEFNFPARIWTIPGARMKGRGAGKPFAVPLTDRMVNILHSLPKTARGFVFTTRGTIPIALGVRKVKRQVDAVAGFSDWVSHDLRRSIATGLTGLKVDPRVADAVLAHRKRGMEAVYNTYSYVEERRHALELWGNKIAPDNITPLRKAV